MALVRRPGWIYDTIGSGSVDNDMTIELTFGDAPGLGSTG